MTADETLDRLARLVGIEPRYVDATGVVRHTSPATKEALIRALGFDAASEPQRHAAIERLLVSRRYRTLPPVVVQRAKRGAAVSVPLTLPAHDLPAKLAWRLQEESGELHEGSAALDGLTVVGRREADGGQRYRCMFRLPRSPGIGYHRLELSGNDVRGAGAETTLIVAPTRCFAPQVMTRGGRLWGFAVQLYALHSARSWGIGDFSDLAAFAQDAARLGAGMVGLNPLHALFPSRPLRYGPYAPSSRLFLNVLYLDVTAVPDLTESDSIQCTDRDLAREPKGRLVDYAAVAARKLAVLTALHRSFRRRHLGEGGQALSARGAAFRRFIETGGRALEHQGIFDALCERFADQPDWRRWPSEYRAPDSPRVRAFARENATRVEFFQYLQWQCHVQLEAAGKAAATAGMPVGLYHDLALGVDPTGAEAWSNRHLLAEGAVLGAPPDAWAAAGQRWGLPPYRPMALRDDRYRALRTLFAANMRHGGALRLDHVMGLKRLFWIPEGGEPADGAYVRYPFEDQLGVLALESRRRRSLVIGEDLGTVPEGFRDRMRRERIFSYRLLYFERDAAGEMRNPETYPTQALVSVGTHDLPTLSGYWHGRDLALRKRIGLFPSPHTEREAHAERREAILRILRGLRRFGLLSHDPGADDRRLDFEIVLAVHRYLAKSRSRMMVVHLEDILGVEEQVNVPGTVDEHPNWRRRIEPSIEEIFRDPRVLRLAEAVTGLRGAGGESDGPGNGAR